MLATAACPFVPQVQRYVKAFELVAAEERKLAARFGLLRRGWSELAHGRHTAPLREAVRTVLLVQQRLGQRRRSSQTPGAGAGAASAATSGTAAEELGKADRGGAGARAIGVAGGAGGAGAPPPCISVAVATTRTRADGTPAAAVERRAWRVALAPSHSPASHTADRPGTRAGSEAGAQPAEPAPVPAPAPLQPLDDDNIWLRVILPLLSDSDWNRGARCVPHDELGAVYAPPNPYAFAAHVAPRCLTATQPCPVQRPGACAAVREWRLACIMVTHLMYHLHATVLRGRVFPCPGRPDSACRLGPQWWQQVRAVTTGRAPQLPSQFAVSTAIVCAPTCTGVRICACVCV